MSPAEAALATDQAPDPLGDLSGNRLKAARLTDRHGLVLAGPGAGKTHLLVAHAAYLAELQQGRIIVLTFSRNAARELQQRITAAISPQAGRLVAARTIHAHALHLLNHYGYRLQLGHPVEPLEPKDVEALSAEVATENGWPAPPGFARRLEGLLRRRALTAADRAAQNLTGSVLQTMRTTGKLSWEMCIDLTLELLDTAPEIRRTVHHHDRFLLLDEAQDCDQAQLEMVDRLINRETSHLFVAMDPNQSLYGFRGADPEAVETWARGYDPLTFELTENHRCQPRIEALARRILGPASPEPVGLEGAALFFYGTEPEEEAEFVAELIRKRIDEGTIPTKLAVLARRNQLLKLIRQALVAVDVETRENPRQEWSPEEDRILAVLHLLHEWEEGLPLSPQGRRTLKQVFGVAATALREMEQRSLDDGGHPGDDFEDSRWQRLVMLRERRLHPSDLVLEGAKLIDEDPERLKALRWLAGEVRTFPQLLRKARQGSHVETTSFQSGVLVTTFHASKGLEFDRVFIIGCEEGTIPDYRARDEKALREERRMLYVAVTRAAMEVVITCTGRRKGQPNRCRPSSFLPEPTDAIWSNMP